MLSDALEDDYTRMSAAPGISPHLREVYRQATMVALDKALGRYDQMQRVLEQRIQQAKDEGKTIDQVFQEAEQAENKEEEKKRKQEEEEKRNAPANPNAAAETTTELMMLVVAQSNFLSANLL